MDHTDTTGHCGHVEIHMFSSFRLKAMHAMLVELNVLRNT